MKMAVSNIFFDGISTFPTFSYPVAYPDLANIYLIGVDPGFFRVEVALPQPEAVQNGKDSQNSTRLLEPEWIRNKLGNNESLWAAFEACKSEEIGVQEAALIYGVCKDVLAEVLKTFDTVDDDFTVFVSDSFPYEAEMEIVKCLQDLIDANVYMSNIDVRKLGYDFIREKYRVPSMPKAKPCVLGQRWFNSMMEKYPELDKTDRIYRQNTANPVYFFHSLENFVTSFGIDSSTIFYMEGIRLNFETCALKESTLGNGEKTTLERTSHIDCIALVCTSPKGMFVPPILIKQPGSSLTNECDVYDIELDESDNEETEGEEKEKEEEGSLREENEMEMEKEKEKEKEEEKEKEKEKEENEEKEMEMEQKDKNENENGDKGGDGDGEIESDSEDNSDDIAMKDTETDDPDYRAPSKLVYRNRNERCTRRGERNTYLEYLTSRIRAKKIGENSDESTRQRSKRGRKPRRKRGRPPSKHNSKRRARQTSKTASEACAKATGPKVETDLETCVKEAEKDSETVSKTSTESEPKEDPCIRTESPELKPQPETPKVKVKMGHEEQSWELKERLMEDWEKGSDPVSPYFFYFWFEKFLSHVRDRINRKILLLIREPNYLKYFQTMELAREYGVVFLVAPPPSYHKIYPLDGFAMSLKRNLMFDVKRWMMENFDFNDTEFPLIELFKRAYNNAVNLSIAKNGFLYSGIWPVNRDVFTPPPFITPYEPDSINSEPLNANDAVCNLDPAVQSELANIKSEEDIQKLCRICMKESTFTQSVFKAQPYTKSTYRPRKLIEELLGVPISRKDGLPTKICNFCVVKLIETTNARKYTISALEKQLKVLQVYYKYNNGYGKRGNQEFKELIQEVQQSKGMHTTQMKKQVDEVISGTWNYNSVCRVCLVKEPFMKSIYDDKTDDKPDDRVSDEVTITQKMTLVSKCEVEPGDGFSSVICLRCRSRINHAYNFILKVLTGHRILRDIVAKVRSTSTRKNEGESKEKGS